jgi:hypothetical protein
MRNQNKPRTSAHSSGEVLAAVAAPCMPASPRPFIPTPVICRAGISALASVTFYQHESFFC